MAVNLQHKGFSVVGWNRSAGRGEPLLAVGGRLAPTIREAVAEADFIITMLADPAAVRAVAMGPEGLLSACRASAVWVECSTIGPSVARELAALAPGAGISFVDAPVLGSVGPATDGSLHFLAGGDVAVVEKARPLLLAMGRMVSHFGPEGQGAAAKVISNMVVGSLLAAVGEGLAVAERLGLDRGEVAEMLMNGPVGAPVVKLKLPLMVNEAFSPSSFQLKWMEKDMALFLTEAGKVGAACQTAAGAHGELAAARAAGYGDLDFAAVAGFIRQMAQGPTGGE